MVTYTCDLCRRAEPAPQPGRFTVIPNHWFWREKTEKDGQMHACSPACQVQLVGRGFEGWRRIDREASAEASAKRVKVGPEKCKICAAMRAKGNPNPCLFHRPRARRVAT